MRKNLPLFLQTSKLRFSILFDYKERQQTTVLFPIPVTVPPIEITDIFLYHVKWLQKYQKVIYAEIVLLIPLLFSI